MAISPESQKIWDNVKANRTRLDGCKRHLWLYEKVTFGQPIKCEHCGGTMQLTDAGMMASALIGVGTLKGADARLPIFDHATR